MNGDGDEPTKMVISKLSQNKDSKKEKIVKKTVKKKVIVPALEQVLFTKFYSKMPGNTLSGIIFLPI